MRMPLVRRGDDNTPIAWWEWLFAPILMPLFLVWMVLLAVLSFPVGLVYSFQQWREEKRLRPRLTAAGRWIDWSEVEAGLRAGVGTLIIEHRSPQGPVREWWTEDDVIARAPIPLPADVRTPPPEEQIPAVLQYGRECAARYVDVESGSARLTEVPVPLGRKLDPRKYVVVDLGGGMMTAIVLSTGRQLAEKYPQGKVVTLVAWSEDPVLAVGDAEAVFLPRSGPGVGESSEGTRD
jgi:hypothetical protein